MLRVIVSFGREPYEHGRFRSQGETAVDERVKLTVRQTAFSLAVNTITAAGTAIVFGFGAYQVIQGAITGGELLVLLSYIASVYQPLESISGTIGHLNNELVQLKGSMQLIDTEPEVKDPENAVPLDGRAAPSPSRTSILRTTRARRR